MTYERIRIRYFCFDGSRINFLCGIAKRFLWLNIARLRLTDVWIKLKWRSGTGYNTLGVLGINSDHFISEHIHSGTEDKLGYK